MMNHETIHNTYEKLMENNPNAWEVYAGEEALKLAREKRIPQEQWEADRVRMQLGQEKMAQFLTQRDLQTSQDRKERIRELISRQIRGNLYALEDDIARRGMLLQALQVGRKIDEEELMQLSQLDEEDLLLRVEERAYQVTMEEVLPSIQKQCDLLLMDNETFAESVLKNPGALAAAVYLENEQIRDYSEVLGYAAEVSTCYDEELTLLQKIALGLIGAACLIAVIYLLSQATTIATVVGATLLDTGAIAEMGTIASAMAVMTECFAEGLVFALGSAILGSLMLCVNNIIDEFTASSGHAVNPHKETATGHNVYA